jgi:Helix-turn-helix of DDE superfamily endonuclease
MPNLEHIFNQDRSMRAMTGLNLQAFEKLLPSFTEAYNQSLEKPGKTRKRAAGGGRKAVLNTPSLKLLYILFYKKSYPTFDVMGATFGFDRSTAHDWVHRLLPILKTALGHEQALPVSQLKSMEEFIENFPDTKQVIIDGTERLIQRPKDSAKQKKHFSGKKKTYS